MQKPPAISIRGLVKHYDKVTAIDNIDLEVGEGEFFGLLGPNGAGKTTTINILAGLCNKSAGKVSLFGHDLISDYRACRLNTGLVPQDFNFDQFAKVRDVLMFQGGYFGLPLKASRARAEKLLSEFGLSEKAESQMRHLSGGMKRRGIILRALMHKPKLLILDEPTAGVDVDLRKTLWTFLRRLNESGITILLTTHYLEEAEALCDRVAIINHGKIIADDSTRNLVNRLSHDSIIVTSANPVHVEALNALSAFSPTINEDSDELTLLLDRRAMDFDEMLQSIRNAGIQISNIRAADNRLERVFLELTGGDGDT